jgi:hypothetical protein
MVQSPSVCGSVLPDSYSESIGQKTHWTASSARFSILGSPAETLLGDKLFIFTPEDWQAPAFSSILS